MLNKIAIITFLTVMYFLPVMVEAYDVTGDWTLSGNLGIGEETPSFDIDIGGTGTKSIFINRTGSYSDTTFMLNFVTASNGDSVTSIQTQLDGSQTAGKLLFGTQVTGGSIAPRLVIESDGEVHIIQKLCLELVCIESWDELQSNLMFEDTDTILLLPQYIIIFLLIIVIMLLIFNFKNPWSQ